MTTEEIKEKYDIEMIGKEMWVWDEDPKDAKVDFVTFKSFRYSYPFRTANDEVFINASETNPNEPQDPQVGDIGYFWDFQNAYAYGALIKIYENQTHKYAACTNSFFINFSKEKQLWMK